MGISNRLSKLVIKDTSVPVVVLKTFNHHGIGIARSLGRLGIDVYGVGISRMAAGLHSRYFKGKFVRDVDVTPKEETVRYLLDIGRKIGKRSILVPTTDVCTVLVADYADRLRDWFIFPDNPSAIVRSLVNKKSMYLLARKNNVPSPETSFPQSRLDVEEYLKNAVFPIMLKGIDGLAAELRSGRKMFVAKTRRQLLDWYDRYEDPLNPNFMLQEFIQGDGNSSWIFNGYFNGNSQCLFKGTGKKIRQRPAHVGAASLAVSSACAPIERIATSFMKQLGYKGIVDIDFCYDSRDDRYKILDVNPRCGSTFRLFVGNNGLDVVKAQYLDLTHQDVPETDLAENRKWLAEDWDLISSSEYFRDGDLPIGQWARSFRGVKEIGWFAWDDLLPCFLMLANLLWKTITLQTKRNRRPKGTGLFVQH